MNRRGQGPAWRRRAAERLDQLLALPMLVLTLVVPVLPVIYPDLPPGAPKARVTVGVPCEEEVTIGEPSAGTARTAAPAGSGG